MYRSSHLLVFFVKWISAAYNFVEKETPRQIVSCEFGTVFSLNFSRELVLTILHNELKSTSSFLQLLKKIIIFTTCKCVFSAARQEAHHCAQRFYQKFKIGIFNPNRASIFKESFYWVMVNLTPIPFIFLEKLVQY